MGWEIKHNRLKCKKVEDDDKEENEDEKNYQRSIELEEKEFALIAEYAIKPKRKNDLIKRKDVISIIDNYFKAMWINEKPIEFSTETKLYHKLSLLLDICELGAVNNG